MLVLILLCLFIALSVRTTPKGTGACFGIQESSVLICLLNISLLPIIVILKGMGAFGELKIVLCKLFCLFLTRLVNYSHYSKGTGAFGDLHIHVCSNHSMSFNCFKYSDHSKRDGCFLGTPGQSFTKGREQFGEFQNHVFSSHPSSASQRDRCLLWNFIFKTALVILCLFGEPDSCFL